MSIAQTFPSLWSAIARHPNAYPDLLTWLDQIGGDDVHQAIVSRNILSLPPVPSPPTSVSEPAEPVTPVSTAPLQTSPAGSQAITGHAAAPLSTPTATVTLRDSGSFGWAVLGFFIPIVGLILWLVWMRTRPRDSKMSRNGFIVGLALAVVATVTGATVFVYVASKAQQEQEFVASMGQLIGYHQCDILDIEYLNDSSASHGRYELSLSCDEGTTTALLPAGAIGQGTAGFGANSMNNGYIADVYLTQGLTDSSPQVIVGGPPADYLIYTIGWIGGVTLADGTQITYTVKGMIFPAGYDVINPDGSTYSWPSSPVATSSATQSLPSSTNDTNVESFPDSEAYPTPAVVADVDWSDSIYGTNTHVTITIGDWVAGQQTNTLQAAWESVGGQGQFPGTTPFASPSAVYAFGTVTYSIIDPGNGNFNFSTYLGLGREGANVLVDTSTIGLGILWSYNCNSRSDGVGAPKWQSGPTTSVCVANPPINSIRSGIVTQPIAIAVDQVFDPNYPSGNPALEGLSVVLVKDNNSYTINGTSNWVLPDRLWR